MHILQAKRTDIAFQRAAGKYVPAIEQDVFRETLDGDKKTIRSYQKVDLLIIDEWLIFTSERIRPIHLYIDQQTLKVDDAIRYRLHGTLIKMVEMFENGYLPDEWCELTTYDYSHELWYIDARAREQHMRDGIEARVYLMDEIDLANALGLDVTEPTEEEWDALDDMDIDDISKRFGADESYRNSVMSISTLGLDILIKITRDIFSALFSDYYEDPVSTLN